MTLTPQILIFIAPILVWLILKNPFFGLLLMIAVNPVEALIPLPVGYSAGRITGALVAAGWFVHLLRNPLARQRLARSKLVRCIWAFPLVCAIGVAIGGGSSVVSAKGVDSLVKLLLLVTLALMIENMVDSPDRMKRMMLVLVLSSLVAVIFPFAYSLGVDLYSPLGIDYMAVNEGERAGGLSGDANSLGVTACAGLFALIIHLNAKRKMFSSALLIGIAVVIISGLILSGNRTHFVGFIVFMVVFSGLRLLGPAKGLSYSILFAMVLILLVPWAYRRAPERIQERLIVVGPNVNKYTEGRADLIEEQRELAIQLLKENPLFGVGLRGFESRFAIMAHDSVSAILGETGLFGLISISWLLVLCVYWLVCASKLFLRIGNLELYYYGVGFMASIVATLVAGLGGYLFFSSRWFWFALGMSAVIARWADSAARLSLKANPAVPVSVGARSAASRFGVGSARLNWPPPSSGNPAPARSAQ